MDLFIVAVTCFLMLTVGAFVFVQDSKAGYSRAFFGISLTTCAWIISNYLTGLTTLPVHVVDVANRITYAAGLGSVVAGLLFTYFFPVKRNIGMVQTVVLIIGGIAAMMLSLTSALAGSVVIEAGEITFTVGPLVWIYIVMFVTTYALIVQNLLFAKPKPEHVQLIQSRLIAIAFLVSGMIALALNVVVPALRRVRWHQVRPALNRHPSSGDRVCDHQARAVRYQTGGCAHDGVRVDAHRAGGDLLCMRVRDIGDFHWAK